MQVIINNLRFLFLLSALILFSNLSAFCQKSNSQKKNETAAIARPGRPVVVDSIEEKLVALAMKGPQANIIKHQGKINEYQLKGAKNAWLNLLTFNINYNDQTFAKQNPQNTYVYPIYYVGITIPMGTLFSRITVKLAHE